ncbi:MAG: FAD-binding oxidoreductase [Trueperaceae bacterium]|nr:FAD-binding oxidoreductase [Trueperaceae bacterium]
MFVLEKTTDQFQELRSQVLGQVLEPHEPGFAQASQGWSLGHKHQPKAVLVAKTTADIVAAVQFAQVHGLAIAVQATGHGFVRAADDALLINLAGLTKVQVNPASQTATVQAGASWAQVLKAASPYGLTGLLGDTPSVGAVGYTLGGGMGWFGRKYGLGCDALLEAQVVTMDGQLRTVSAEHQAELFWGLKGGAGGLAIVTEMTIKLYLESAVTAAQFVFPLEYARQAMEGYREWLKRVPDELSSRLMFAHGPDVPFLPPFLRNQTALIIQAVYAGPETEAAKTLEALSFIPGSIAQIINRIRPAELGMFFGAPPAPSESVGQAEQLSEFSDEVIELALAFAKSQPAPFYMFELRQLGGAVANISHEVTAFAHRNAAFLLNYHALVFSPEVRAKSQLSVSAFSKLFAPVASGEIMPNFLNGDEGEARDHAAYPGLKSMRLAMLKARFDPENRLRYARTPGSRSGA